MAERIKNAFAISEGVFDFKWSFFAVILFSPKPARYR